MRRRRRRRRRQPEEEEWLHHTTPINSLVYPPTEGWAYAFFLLLSLAPCYILLLLLL